MEDVGDESVEWGALPNPLLGLVTKKKTVNDPGLEDCSW